MDTELDISSARKQLNAMDEMLSNGPVVYVTRHKRRVFAIILHDPQAMHVLAHSLEDIAQGRLHNHAEIEAELG